MTRPRRSGPETVEQRARRLAKVACRLLRASQKTVAEVAWERGYLTCHDDRLTGAADSERWQAGYEQGYRNGKAGL